jgi:regulator of nucleoside diphosphate kinase
MNPPEIIITRSDLERLGHLMEWHASARDNLAVQYLENELSRARVVNPSDVPTTVVTMNSRFRYVDCSTGQARTATLVYPADADAASGKLSVLAPVGCALLGLAVGQTIEWPLPGGQVRRFRIEEILYQPEAAGES